MISQNQNNMNKKIVWIVVGIIVLVGVFYGGMTYGGNNVRAAITSRGLGQNSTFAGTRGARGAGAFGGATTGQILSKDATSITVGLTAGGSKIIFLDNSTPITKQTSGTMADLTVGTQVSVMGSANADGSLTAQTVQIRPANPAKNTTP